MKFIKLIFDRSDFESISLLILYKLSIEIFSSKLIFDSLLSNIIVDENSFNLNIIKFFYKKIFLYSYDYFVKKNFLLYYKNEKVLDQLMDYH